jgi:hypothetical protein
MYSTVFRLFMLPTLRFYLSSPGRRQMSIRTRKTILPNSNIIFQS